MSSSFARLKSCRLVTLWSCQRLVHPDKFVDELVEIVFVARVRIVAVEVLVEDLLEVFVQLLCALVL